jgi:predicted nucleic acid-binding protein
MFLIDTNVLSELIRPRPKPARGSEADVEGPGGFVGL